MLGSMLTSETKMSKNRQGPCVHHTYSLVGETTVNKIISLIDVKLGIDKYSEGKEHSSMIKTDQFKSHWIRPPR